MGFLPEVLIALAILAVLRVHSTTVADPGIETHERRRKVLADLRALLRRCEEVAEEIRSSS